MTLSRSRHGRIAAVLLGTWLVSLGVAGAAAPGDNAQFDEASQAYKGGNFARAREIFEGLAGEHKGNASLCYNLGNTYYRLGQMGRAILWYERALRARPYDSDIRENLALARAGIKGNEENPLEKVLGFPKIIWLLETATTCLWVGAAALVLLLLKRDDEQKFFKSLAVFSFSLWAVLSVWGIIRWWNESQPWAIVITPDIPVRSGPGEGFAVGATAPEGLKILMLGEREGWALVGLPKAGIKGWTPTAGIERIE